MSGWLWVGLVFAVIAVLAAMGEAMHHGASYAFSVLFVLAFVLGSLVYRERQENIRLDEIITTCLDNGNTARFQGGIYIGCYRRD